MKENMYYNFLKLQNRILDSLEKTDLIEVKKILESIDEPTIVSGVGGSSVVSNFLSKVLSTKNCVICENVTARDLIYKNIDCFKNIIACSYSGENFGVDTSFDNHLNKYLLSKTEKGGIVNIKYSSEDIEKSFISLAATLIPMTILLAYYLDNDISIIKEILKILPEFDIKKSDVYEILTGYETSTASKFIESTFVESGIGIPIIHDKYDYCHGRSTLGYNFDNSMIFFNMGNELDKLYEKELSNNYKNVIKFDRKYDDYIINDYYFTYLSMMLCKKIAEQKEKDLSIVEYSPLVKKLYYFKGEM